jgi:hypothetical protein
MSDPEYTITRLEPGTDQMRAVRVDEPLRLCPRDDPECSDPAHVLKCPECGESVGLVFAVMLVSEETIRAQCCAGHNWQTFLPISFMRWLLAHAA